MSNVVGVGQISLMDLNDAIIAGIPPSNPTVGTLWIDESQDPPMLKKWNGEAWIDLGELDPNLSVVIEEINETLGNMANDNLINFQERQVVKDKLTEIIGYVIADTVTSLPSVSTLDNSGKGSFWSVRKSARNVGIPTSNTTYVNVATKYNNLKSYLESLTPIVPWDTRNANADVVISVTKSTFRDMWLQYYLAVDALAELTAQKIKENNDELKNDVDVIGRDLDSLTGRVTTVESKVTDTAIVNTVTRSEAWVQQINVINNKATPQDIDNAINNLEISGRNLFRPNITAKNRETSEVTRISPTSFYVDTSWASFSERFLISAGEVVTVSFWAKTDSLSSDTLWTQRIGFTTETGNTRTSTHNHTVTVTNEWKYFENTFTVANGTKSMEFHATTNNGDVWINGLMIVRGNKAPADWTPAPEDIEDSIDILSTRINNVEQEITADKIVTTITESTTFQNILDSKADVESLGGFATKDELDELSGEVDGKIDDAIQGIDFSPYATKLELEETSRNITAKFSATGGMNLLKNSIGFADVDFWNTIYPFEIGGRNLLRNTDFRNGLNNWFNWGTATREVVDLNGKKWVHLSQNDSNRWRGISQLVLSIKPSTPYTVSFIAYSQNNSVMTVGFHQRLGNTIVTQNWQTFTLTNSPKKYSYTFTTTGSSIDLFNFMIGNDQSPFDIYITDIKLELGNRATDWTPAPEDNLNVNPLTIRNTELDTLGFGSGFHFTGDGRIKGLIQEIPVATGQPYTLSWYVNKYSSSLYDGEVRIEIIEDDTVTVMKQFPSDEVTTGYEHGNGVYIPYSDTIHIRIVGESRTEAVITGLMLNIGDVPLQWSLATGEVYNTNIRMDINGIRVSQLDKDRREIGYTQITPDEFAGYYDTTGNGGFEKVFYLNGEETVTKKFRAEDEITMGGIKVIKIQSENYNGWAFVPVD
jgi:hypothetical protein